MIGRCGLCGTKNIEVKKYKHGWLLCDECAKIWKPYDDPKVNKWKSMNMNPKVCPTCGREIEE